MTRTILSLCALYCMLVPRATALNFVSETLYTNIDGCDVRVRHFPPRGQMGVKGAPVVYLQHGLLDSTETWLANGGSALAPYLQSAGYDVWMADSRGNQYSPCPSAPDLTWDDLADDLRFVVDFVLSTSGASNLTYIGHSQGAAILYAALSTGAVQASTINVFFSLGAPVFMANQYSPVLAALGALHTDVLIKNLPPSVFTGGISVLRAALSKLSGLPLTPDGELFRALFGDPTNIMDPRSNWQQNFPAATTPANLAHWVQAARYGDFRYYNPYIFPKKQLYDLDAIPSTVRIVAYYGLEDAVATTADHRTLFATLGPRLLEEVAVPGFAHLDFTYAYNARSMVYDRLLSQLHEYAPL